MPVKSVKVASPNEAYEQFRIHAARELAAQSTGTEVDFATRAFDLIAIDRVGEALKAYLHMVEDVDKGQVTPAFDPGFDKVISETRAAGLKDTASLLNSLTSYQARNARMKAAQLAAKH